MLIENKVIILVISHKPILTENEIFSLKRLYQILGNYPIKFISPTGLDTRHYQKIHSDINFDFVNPKWLSNYRNFNKFKISKFLYKKYSSYEYILFYEPDAYVFDDKLIEWCNLGYDYIGAPWFKPCLEQHDLHKAFWGVGNGGLSLRKTSSMLKVLYTFKYVYSWKECIQFLKSKKDIGTIKKILSLIKSFTVSNNFHHLFNNFGNNEDYFWGIYVTKSFAWYKTPDKTTALQFSFEKRVAESYELNNKSLPMGCHKWWNDDVIDFWKVHITFPKDTKQENAE